MADGGEQDAEAGFISAPLLAELHVEAWLE